MKPPPFEYYPASSVDEAVSLLAEHGDDAKVLAGGQSLVPLLALRLARPEVLIDINRVPELAGLENGSGLRVGPMVRQRVAERSEVVASGNPLLADALRFIGHPAIRNRGTLGGSLAHADPAAELPAVLLALDGEIEATSSAGTRTIAAQEFFEGFLSTTLGADELVTSVRFAPWGAATGWSFQEFSRRSGDFAIAGVAAVLRLGANGLITEARIALSGVDATPIRAAKAEAGLIGQPAAESVWEAAVADTVSDLDPPADLHGSSAYRRQLVGVLLRRALREAHQRAGGTA